LEKLPPLPTSLSGRLSRLVRHFPITPEVEIRADERGSQYLMTSPPPTGPACSTASPACSDEHGITLHTAKIATLASASRTSSSISGKELSQTATLVRWSRTCWQRAAGLRN
jgi:[protein-PII] uridylyltransferase